jgi:hypothetical protein
MHQRKESELNRPEQSRRNRWQSIYDARHSANNENLPIAISIVIVAAAAAAAVAVHRRSVCPLSLVLRLYVPCLGMLSVLAPCKILD